VVSAYFRPGNQRKRVGKGFSVPSVRSCECLEFRTYWRREADYISPHSAGVYSWGRSDDQAGIGEALRDLQKGLHLGMPLSRPMPEIASGAHELRVTGKTSSVRVFYLVKLADAILVFHAFQKKTQKTPKREIILGQQRLKEVLHGND